MFLIRRPKTDDASTLLKLAKMVHFINLPPDRDVISSKIMTSRACFAKAAGALVDIAPDSAPPKMKPGPTGVKAGVAKRLVGTPAIANGHAGTVPGGASGSAGAGESHGGGASAEGLSHSKSDMFMFVLEDTETRSCLGTSQIIAHMGGPGNPNLSFKLSRKEFFSTSLQFGATHIVAKLFLDESGPSELGGLILQPSYRNHKAKLGRLLSLVRFHFIALHRALFSDRLIAELMAPISPDGQNLLWEYLGRRFINLTYTEADRFCQYSREFMLTLLPREEIYLTLLPPEARVVVGEVGPETLPARRMLEKLGFRYKDFVDPFDGGPHLEAQTGDIKLIRDTRSATAGEPIASSSAASRGIVSHLRSDGEFFACFAEFTQERGAARLTRDTMNLLEIEPGATIGVTPMEQGKSPAKKSVPKRAAVAKS
jgi:arginine N-succinyltransferase